MLRLSSKLIKTTSDSKTDFFSASIALKPIKIYKNIRLAQSYGLTNGEDKLAMRMRTYHSQKFVTSVRKIDRVISIETSKPIK